MIKISSKLSGATGTRYMKIKYFLIIIYSLAGLLISILSSFMTYLIIGKPIGYKMILQITMVIVFLTPFIGVISFFFGRYLSGKFDFIKLRLQHIKSGRFVPDTNKNSIKEIEEISQNINFLSVWLESLIEDLKQKNQNLSNLLISMAHDIKTPITILNGYIEELKDGIVTDEEMPKVLSHMKEEVKFLDELTVDMLNFITSMQNSKIKQKINLHSLIENEIFPMLSRRDDLRYLNETDENFFITFNKIDLKKVFLNILNNAIRHTQNGYIKVYTNKDGIIAFENSGEEIKEEFKEKIFEPFFTISKSKNRKKSGFGLGLSIVKNLCQNNGYTCTLQSSDTIKTVFYLKEINKEIV